VRLESGNRVCLGVYDASRGDEEGEPPPHGESYISEYDKLPLTVEVSVSSSPLPLNPVGPFPGEPPLPNNSFAAPS